MTTLTNTLEGGSDTVTISTGNSGGASGTAFNQATTSGTGVLKYQASGALKGSLSARITADSASTVIYGWDDLGVSGSAGVGYTDRFYIYFLADTSANGATYVQYRTAAGTICATILMNTGYSLRLGNNAGSPVTGTTIALSPTTLYRVETWIDPGTSTATGACRWSVWNADDFTTPVIDVSQTGQNFSGTGAITRVRRGKTGVTGSADYITDSIVSNDTSGSALIGPDVPLAQPRTYSYVISAP